MTLYDLGQAIFRYRRFLWIGLGVLLIAVLVLALDFSNDGIQWRGSAKYQAGYQISVVAPGTVSLSEPETGANLDSAASAYGDLLSSGEAARAVGDMSGYRLDEPIVTTVSEAAPIISATVIGPSYDEAIAAALNSFAWLAEKIEQPLDAQPPVSTATTTPEVLLNAPFTASMAVIVDEDLASVDDDLIVIVTGGFESGPGQAIVVPIADRAGTPVLGAATLDPNGSILLNLEREDGTQYGQLRLVPDPLPDSAAAYPDIEITLGPDAIESAVTTDPDTGDDTRVWQLTSSAITAEWIAGTPQAPDDAATTEQFQIALLTDEPSALQIGGRRGPLLAFAVLIVGFIGLLTAVIIADTWRRDRDSKSAPGDATPPGTNGGSAGSTPAADGAESPPPRPPKKPTTRKRAVSKPGGKSKQTDT